MKDRPLVEDIRIRYKKSHQKPTHMNLKKFIKENWVEIILVAVFVLLMAGLFCLAYTEQK